MQNKQIVLSTGRWFYYVTPVDGLTIHDGYPTIFIDANISGRKRLETIAHETLHASKPLMTEEEVTRIAADIGKALWLLGYRSTSLPLRAQPKRQVKRRKSAND